MTAKRFCSVTLAAIFLAGTTLGALAQSTGSAGSGGSNSFAGSSGSGASSRWPGGVGAVAPGPVGSGPVVIDPPTTGAIGVTGPGPLPDILNNSSDDPNRPCPPNRESLKSRAGGPSATRC